MTGTWISAEVQKAVQLVQVIQEKYEVHHFPKKSKTLCKTYNETFFEIKRTAKAAGNKGLEAIAKMCINGPTGKWGFNPAKQKAVRIVQDTADFFSIYVVCGTK